MEITNKKIEFYCKKNSTHPDPICNEIHDYTFENVECPQMVIGPLEASLLRQLIAANKSKSVLEIGTFTGYSALAMASALPETGKLVTLDISQETTEVAKSFWSKSPNGSKITALVGNALDSLKSLNTTFDFVFIDADKENYLNYLKASLELLSDNGIIVLDNMLWSGEVLSDSPQASSTIALKEVTKFITENSSLENCLLPVRDGMMIVRKLN